MCGGCRRRRRPNGGLPPDHFFVSEGMPKAACRRLISNCGSPLSHLNGGLPPTVRIGFAGGLSSNLRDQDNSSKRSHRQRVRRLAALARSSSDLLFRNILISAPAAHSLL